MQKLIHFFEKRILLVTYVFLLSVSMTLIRLTDSGSSYKFFVFQSAVSGQLNKFFSGIGSYFSLQSRNEELLHENLLLQKRLLRPSFISPLSSSFQLTPAHIISHFHDAGKDFVIIDKGTDDGIVKDAGAFTPKGIMGIVIQTSPHFAKIMTLRNENISVFVKPADQPYTGFTFWDEANKRLLITDFPEKINLHPGDTIITAGNSLFFPRDIPVGRVQKVFFENDEKKIVIEPFLQPEKTYNIFISVHPLKKELDSITHAAQ